MQLDQTKTIAYHLTTKPPLLCKTTAEHHVCYTEIEKFNVWGRKVADTCIEHMYIMCTWHELGYLKERKNANEKLIESVQPLALCRVILLSTRGHFRYHQWHTYHSLRTPNRDSLLYVACNVCKKHFHTVISDVRLCGWHSVSGSMLLSSGHCELMPSFHGCSCLPLLLPPAFSSKTSLKR